MKQNDRTLIRNVTAVMEDHLIPDTEILIGEGKIVRIGKGEIPEDCRILDGKGLYLGPGLIDIHTHGADREFITKDPAKAAAFLMDHGVTGVLPALYFNLKKEDYIKGLRTVREAMRSGKAENLIGVYMEGPYLNPKFGCSRENNPWAGPIRREDYAEILDEAAGLAAVWCVAPEREGVEEFVKEVRRKDPAAVFSVAHSEAAPEQIEALMPLGLRLATHHTNATGTIFKYSECRGVCVDETVAYYDDIYAELICDSLGMHVDPRMLRLIRKIKGENRIILVSDNFPCNGKAPKGYEHVKDINFDNAGEIAGSKLSLDIACRNMMVHTGASLCDVFRYASRNPADLLGRYHLGRIRAGANADLILVDPEFHVYGTVKNGDVYKWNI